MLRDSGLLRMQLHGKSMLPSIAEAMVLQLGSSRYAGIGDVVVFRDGEVNVAHRIVARETDGFRTSGDAQPHVVESVPFACVVGRVQAIWSDASEDGQRVDGPAHRLRGWYFARFHRMRRMLRIAGYQARYLVERAQPRRRARVAPRFVAAIRAVVRGEADGLVAALACDAAVLATVEQRHRCAAMFGDAARRLGVTERLAPDVAADFRRARLGAVIATGRMEQALERTITVLRSAGIEFALLKGAARVYSKMPGAAFHPSDDIDIFVPRHLVDDTVRALQSRGWSCANALDERRRYRKHHHHAVPLFSPEGDFPVEIHHELALPGTLSLDTSWDALAEHLVSVDGSAGPVLQLDRMGTALHLAIHAIGLTRLRDVALLAFLLPQLSIGEREGLAAMVEAERLDPLRLAASLALAARVAGLAFPEGAGIATYLRWALRREDLPGGIRRRSDAAEVYFARPDAPWAGMYRLAPWWTRGAKRVGLPLRILGRCATSVLAAAYAAGMAEGEFPLAD
ncbi:MAG: nucleotidyltransferase family protein [Candidatus Lustribacter sp.]